VKEKKGKKEGKKTKKGRPNKIRKEKASMDIERREMLKKKL
jgi:hypothetical protein